MQFHLNLIWSVLIFEIHDIDLPLALFQILLSLKVLEIIDYNYN